MVLATLGALGGQYAIGKIEANSANSAAKKAQLSSLWQANWLAEQNYKRQVNFAKHAHQYEMEDLKNAGLNPALTAMGGQGATAGGGGGIGSMVPRTSKGVNLGNMTDFLKNSRENRLADYQELMAKANSAKAIQETANLAEENPYISKKMKAEIANTQAESAKAIADAGKAQMETETGWKIMDYRVSQEFGKAAQELYQGRLSDVSADFLNNYHITRDEAFRLGEDGLKVLGGLAGMGIGKHALGTIGKAILKKGNSAKALSFSNFPR